MSSPSVTHARLIEAPRSERRGGLLGFVQVVLNGGLQLDGITLRKTRDGRITLSFPSRTDHHGREHAIIRPVDQAARTAFVREVLAALGIEGGTP